MTSEIGEPKRRTRRKPSRKKAAPIDERLVARIEKAVLEKVMAEVRPLLTELAELSSARRTSAPGPIPAAQALHDEALKRMEELQKILSDRIRQSEARFLKNLLGKT